MGRCVRIASVPQRDAHGDNQNECGRNAQKKNEKHGRNSRRVERAVLILAEAMNVNGDRIPALVSGPFQSAYACEQGRLIQAQCIQPIQ